MTVSQAHRSLNGVEAKAPELRGLPATWYSSPAMYELERRAIFSKKWLFITHKSRFTKPGDYVRFEEAGFSFFLCLDKESKVRGFHNICRHRGFPVITKDSGNAKIIACKYHGWSYGIDGRLAKAPRFETVPDFKKEDNGLLPIHVHIDALGFVWVNLEASTTPSVAWEDDFSSIDTQERFRHLDFSQYSLDHVWRMEADFNWKTLADNYNECYHCSVAHPDVKNMVDLDQYDIETTRGHILHFYRPKSGKDVVDVQNMSTFYFPNACMTVSPHFFYLMRCVPSSAVTVSLEYEVYRHKDASTEDFEYVDAFFKRILIEDKDLCVGTQRNLNAGVFVNGRLHPQLEKGPTFFQSLVRSLLTTHKDKEDEIEREIWPGRQIVDQNGLTEEDSLFCSRISCQSAAHEW